MSQMITAKDVAKIAKVSTSAVSRAFTPGASISEETRRKVLKVSEEMGYQPNLIARGLRRKHSGLIGFGMLRTDHPTSLQIQQDFVRQFQELGYSTLILNIMDAEHIDEALPQAFQYSIDGLILVAAGLMDKLVESCAKMKVPVVLLKNYSLSGRVHSVCCDNRGGGRIAAEAFVNAGMKRLAYITGSEETYTNRDRETGFRDVLKANNLELIARENGDFTYESGYQAAMRMFQNHKDIEGLFCASDLMALGAMDAVRHEFGMGIPEDLSVIGFDNIPMAAWPSYDLTTINMPNEALVNAAVGLVMEAIESDTEEAVLKFFPGKLIHRSSTRF